MDALPHARVSTVAGGTAAAAGTVEQEAGRGDYVDSKEAMKLLGIRQQTLYAYVSRGLIASLRQADRKDHLYLRADVERMVLRSLARTGHGALAASAMNWGEPIVPTTITEITPLGPRYRGHLAAGLAQRRSSFESVAELLWTGLLDDHPVTWPVSAPAAPLVRLTRALTSAGAADQLHEIFSLVTLQMGVSAGAESGTSACREDDPEDRHGIDAARALIQVLAGCMGYAGPAQRFVPLQPGQSVIQGLLQALGLRASNENAEALEAMLILLADHELSPGTLCARVCASGGSALHSCLASGLCAIGGKDIGRHFLRVDEFLDGAPNLSVLLARAADCQRRGAVVPGFVHPVYPRGDPRARYLLALLQRRPALSPASRALLKFVDEMAFRFDTHPRHELGMVALSRELGLARQAPGALFALARTAGWVAHVHEQRQTGTLLRPRAKFVGVGDADSGGLR
jgi:citrate synthase